MTVEIYLQKYGLGTLLNRAQVAGFDGNTGHLCTAIALAADNNFLSQRVLDDFFNHPQYVWPLASVLVHLKKADLIPDFNAEKSLALTSASARISVHLDAELQASVYRTLLCNLQHLHALEMELRYVSLVGLRHNITNVMKTIEYAGYLNIATHNLNGSNHLTQQNLDKLFLDPSRATAIAKEIYSAPPAAKVVAQPAPKLASKVFPIPPKITIRYG